MRNPSISEAETPLAGDILIVDDTLANLRLLSDMLVRQGYKVRTAPDGLLALTSAQAIPPDLILLDIKMPGMSGYEVCERLKADPRTRDVPIIFISALDQIEDKVKAFKLGGVDYVAKPFQVPEVLARVETHLSLREMRLKLEEQNKKLRESEERYRALTTNLPVGVYRTSMEGQILFANPALARMLGFGSIEELQSTTAIDHYVDPTAREQQLETWKTQGGVIRQEITLQRKDGALIWVRDIGQIIFDEDGEIVHIEGVLEDITACKQAEEELRVKDSAIASSITPIALANLEGNLTYVNDSFLQIWGYDDDSEILGKPAVGFWQTPEKAMEVVEVLQSGGSWTGELIATKKDETPFDVQVSVSLVTTAETGQPICMMGSFVDVSERNLMERRLREQERLAAVGQLAAGFAHDFNNILTSTLLHADVLRHRPHLPALMAPGLEGIISESRRAANLVQQFLDFGRRSILDRRRVDLRTLVEDVSDTLRRSLPETVRVHIGQEQGDFEVNVDPGRIEQALMNLADNAQDAMPEGGELRIGLSRVSLEPGTTPPVAEMESGEWVCLTVSDTGTGIPAEALLHIFEPFFTTKEVGQGTGLGLPQVYGIVKQHDGHISVETGEGRGTTIRVFLPPLTMEDVGDAPRKEKGGLPSVEEETILLVEAYRQLREVVQEALETQGHRVLVAANERDALRIHHSAEMDVTERGQRVDLVIIDMTTAAAGGIHLMQELRKANPRVKGLAITEHALEEDQQALRDVGIVDAIRKPCDVDVLLKAVQQALK